MTAKNRKFSSSIRKIGKCNGSHMKNRAIQNRTGNGNHGGELQQPRPAGGLERDTCQYYSGKRVIGLDEMAMPKKTAAAGRCHLRASGMETKTRSIAMAT